MIIDLNKMGVIQQSNPPIHDYLVVFVYARYRIVDTRLDLFNQASHGTIQLCLAKPY